MTIKTPSEAGPVVYFGRPGPPAYFGWPVVRDEGAQLVRAMTLAEIRLGWHLR